MPRLLVLLGDGHDSEVQKQSTADMTTFVQNLLQQMVTIHIFRRSNTRANAFLLQQSSCILDSHALDEMGGRIDELEQSINELKNEMGIEGSPSPLPPKAKPTDDSA
ncbi:hypothetical protein SAY86_022079 [Trapa natans]|uniref:Uncharacterized protein n=1 Tax=Trapa natans TaxID=22666 RepID=A0AAN7MLL0_TRANT|nr:hypothetical protein SAY86_022079 [Trapa natans]